MKTYGDYLVSLIAQGGPTTEEYHTANQWANDLFASLDDKSISTNVLEDLRSLFTPLHTSETMHGMAYQKPHGYAGDFEIIDRHYRQYLSTRPCFQKWDMFWHWGAAATAVRNRPTYLRQVIERCSARKGAGDLRILNLGSGPAQDIALALDKLPNLTVRVDCIEHNPKAIAYARHVCAHLGGRVRFFEQNALRLRPEGKYDIVWAGGLFDYFSDRVFRVMLDRMTKCIHPWGEVVVGNFSENNPNAGWMSFCEWHIRHRSPDNLRQLATAAHIPLDRICIGREAAGVNIFLHVAGA